MYRPCMGMDGAPAFEKAICVSPVCLCLNDFYLMIQLSETSSDLDSCLIYWSTTVYWQL
uniref:Uncharacterized protein n=1 Tax=Rhizophora mucronata TaxID=61149 RepID=A0A2P2PQL5_RHIMU